MQPRRLLQRFPPWQVLIVLALFVAVLVLVAPYPWAWYHLQLAKTALDRYHPETARDHLARCLQLQPNSIQGHLLASRAARQAGDFAEADGHLHRCQSLLGSTSDSIAFEWALLQAAAGNLREVEEFLQRRADQDPESAPLVWEAVAEGYTRVYRILDALACLDHWLAIDPDNLRALELRGLAYQNGKSASKGAEDFRRVLDRDPTREATRWRLALCLLDMGRYEEAARELEQIARDKPSDPEVLVRLARCRNMLGQTEEARALLDAVLEEHPDHALALRTRGQFALADRQPDRAERWLRLAVAASPSDYQSHWFLFQALQQQNKTAEAAAQLQLAQDVKDRSERLGDLRSRKLSEQPLSPALHYEMGMLLLRTGHREVGESWLLSALSLDPDYRPAHAALAEYYERQGNAQQAAEHRRLAGGE